VSHPGHGADPTWMLAAVVAVTLLLAQGWAAATVRSRSGHRWPTGRTVAFATGVLALAAGLSPLVDLAGPPARAHMVQHVVLGMLAPLGLVLGAPLTLALAVLPVRARRRGTALLGSAPVGVLTHPLTAGILHVGGLYALYLTPLHARTLEHAGVDALVLVHFVVAGCLFAWSLVGPERVARRTGTGWRIGVLVAASAAHGYLAKLLYARAPGLPPGGVAGAADLRDAARWMYYAGDVAEVALAVALFAAWYRRAGRRTATTSSLTRGTRATP
jgi:putative membrane protein